MNLKLRFTFFSMIWLTIILIFLNVFIYYFVLKITTDSEVQLLWNKADSILQKEEISDPSKWDDPNWLKEFLVSEELIRIVDTQGRVRTQIFSDDELLTKKPAFSSYSRSTILNSGNERIVYIQTPILHNGNQIGMLEIGRLVEELDDYLTTLIYVLLSASGVALFISLVVGYFYVDLLVKPINDLIQTMQIIQKSGTFRKLKISNQNKEDELTVLGRTFNDMMGQLEETFNRQQQFITDVSHELRTPLTVIQSYAGLLKRWGREDEPVREEAIEAIQSETQRLKGMTEQLMKLLNTNHVDTQNIKPLELVSLVKTAAHSLETAFQREIIIQASPQKMEAQVDEEKIVQLLIILLDNAIKYSKEKIVIKLWEEEDSVNIEVSDQGVGISQENLPYVFDRFYRVDKARNRSTGGLGLGLAIAKQIVELHSGSIGINSKEGIGTTVIVSLPKTFKSSGKE